jgi:hypothetical protein
MSYLAVAYFHDVEGPSDWQFLEPLCRRLIEELLRRAEQPIEIQQPFLALGRGRREVDTQRELAREHTDKFHIAFLHTDGRGDPDRAYRERIEPVAAALPQGGGARIVGVVPVHETEAWMLCDGNALRDALGSSLDDRRLGVPQVGQIESLGDPKMRLDSICAAGTGGRQGRQPRRPPRETLGETIALDALRRLRAFRSLEATLCRALVELGFLPN